MAALEKRCHSEQTFYCKVRCLAIISKVAGAFPLQNILSSDGRNIKHSFFSLIHLFDIFCGGAYMYTFTMQCYQLIDPAKDVTFELEDNKFSIWLSMTCWIVVIRGVIQFLVVHIFAGRFPALFTALEEYYQSIGANLVNNKPRVHSCTKIINLCMNTFLSVIGTIFILILSLTFSIFFFKKLNPELTYMTVLPVSTSYLFANLWKELPMNMFTKLCIQITRRFIEVKEETNKIREKHEGKDLTVDIAKDIEKIRLQHAALVRIVTLLQQCYGVQLVVNFTFLVVEVVMQLFVFFIITNSEDVFLLGFAVYYLIAAVVLLAFVERMECTAESLLEEIAAFEVYSASRELQLQIQLFTAQLTAKPLKLSASGFFNVNNAMLVALLGGVATYLVMMVQFAPYINNQWSNLTF